ncbi:MAG: DUF5693 family protein [Halanaerobiaceae bacterium]
MNKKIILVLFLIAVLSSLISLSGRYQAENSVKSTELIMDYQALEMLDVEDKDNYLSLLRNKGLTAVAVYPEDLDSIVSEDKASFVTGKELEKLRKVTDTIKSAFLLYPYHEDSAFIVIDDKDYIARFQQILRKWSENYSVDYHLHEDELIIFFENWKSDYRYLSIGINEKEINNIEKNNLIPIPRFNNHQLVNEQNWDIMDRLSPSIIIFAGQEITGYGDINGLKKTAKIMEENKIILGMIEPFIAKQDGASTLARNLDYDLLRVHSIQQVEMDHRRNYTVDNIIDRYLRAVRERNVRLLYLRPFLESRNNIPAKELTLSYIGELSGRLEEIGYTASKIETYDNFRSSNLLLILSSIGIIIAVINLFEYILDTRFRKYFWLLLILAVLGELLFLLSGQVLLLRKILALVTAITFPSLAVISQLFKKQGNHFVKFLKGTAISLIGVLFLSSALADIAFVLYVEQFTGVKLSFVFPLFLITIYYIRKYNELGNSNLQKSISDFWEASIKVKHIVIIVAFAIAGVIYISRTGNNPIFPVSGLEINIRNLLENLLLIRPRFKELMGHPAFILVLASGKKIYSRLYYYPLLMVAAIAQVNILNTFSHIHTPFMVSLIRTFHGLWMGILLAAISLILIQYIEGKWDRIVNRFIRK